MTVERIFISSARGGAQVECRQATAVAGAGIEGDRYFNRNEAPGQNLTMIEAEEVERFIEQHNRQHDLSITNRNLVTRGVRLNDLVGAEFWIGDVKLRGVRLCEPCLDLGKALASPTLSIADVVKHFVHRGGLRVDVLSGGVIQVGASLTNCQEAA